MNPLHEELKEIRIKKEVSLEHISSVTKIRIHILEKLENGELSILSQPYIRAFLREYAEVIGINPDRVIERIENKINTILEEPPSGKKSLPMTDVPVTKKKIPKKKRGKYPGKSSQSVEKTSESNDKSPDVIQSEASQDSSEHAAGKIKHSGIRQSDKGTSKDNTDKIAHTKLKSNQLEVSESTKSEMEPSIFISDEEESSETASADEKKALALPDASEGVTRRNAYTTEDTGSKKTLFFVVVLILIVIAAVVILWMNKSGIF